MLDQKELRNNLEQIKEKLKKRGEDYNLEYFKKLDSEYLEELKKLEEKKMNHNSLTKEVPILKSKGEDANDLLRKMKELSDNITTIETNVKELESKIKDFLLTIPNTPSEKVPFGEDEAHNIEIRKFKEPTTFNFEPMAHDVLATKLNILDFERGAKVTGSRFTFYRGLGAKLERSLISFMLDIHTNNGYTELMPPVIINSNSMIGTGQLPKFEEDMFKISETDYYMSPTAEVPITNFHKNEILDGSTLPIKYCAYSPCFRAEAGSAGRDTKGIIRQHQFNKIELVKFTSVEDSYTELESLLLDAENILKLLELPYRVVILCGGDIGFTSALTYDIEVWMPSYGRYVEISSCSNFESFQARRANIRYKNNPKDKAKYVHTINGSGLAVGRLFASILENYQQEDGSIKIPKAIEKYMGISIIK
ncbi:MAG: serine--tRNA ligase [Defluviitaleaceae bacterium]|nr:serine--tRNA ligase [Defluviitaleaceae bacterium]